MGTQMFNWSDMFLMFGYLSIFWGILEGASGPVVQVETIYFIIASKKKDRKLWNFTKIVIKTYKLVFYCIELAELAQKNLRI